MENSDNFASLTAETKAEADRLFLSYAVRNLTGADLFLFNRMYDDVDEEGRYRVSPNTCNVVVEQGCVVVSKKIPSLPPFMLVEAPNLPCVTLVPRGGVFSEKLELRLPLRPWTPYADLEPQCHRSTMPLVFELGYFIGREGTRALAKEVPTNAGLLPRFAPFSAASQSLIRVGPFPSVEVLGD
ncbi:hypothetical protein EZJ19_08975 [Parasulfuritortus cantonensis]|uniref:Uncharacterized protein n=1 Tax=Parasulfuritortus cantonensis TaxID=2528202 RepID=A0A4R1BCJ2_9PROT|nr:hypothetical protein [Parasulfuritortus cantonensis]TCJ14707.1 hypothetical protein EZJ19_08975 [Parasulfuritortus cantonensis]